MKFLIVSAIYLLGPFFIILLFNRVQAMRKLGTILMAYGVGILLSLLNLTPSSPEEQANLFALQQNIMNIAVPLAIPLMLFSSDFKLWSHSLSKSFSAMLGGIVSIVLGVVLGFFVFKGAGIQDFWKASGMMVGMYTGGTMNFAAIGQSLHVDSTLFTLFSTFEMLLSFLFLMFIVGGGFRIFRKILPFPDAAITKDAAITEADFSFEEYRGMLRKGTFGKMMLGLLLSVGCLALAAGLSKLLTGELNELIVIFTITTLAIGASFIKPVRELPKTFELGMFLIILFSMVIASQFDITKLSTEHLVVVGFIVFVLVVSTTLHLLISRIFRIPGDLFTIAHVSLLYSPPFVPPVSAAMHNRKVLVSGIVIGLAGWAVGTYLGVGVAELLLLISTP